MRASQIFILIVVLALASILIYSLTQRPDNKQYSESLLNQRKEKDEFMKNSPSSPFAENPAAFTALNYFEPDPAFVAHAALEPVQQKNVRSLQTSSGEEQQYLEYAWAVFDINNIPCRLLILESMGPGPSRGTLFLGFTDGTSTQETYGAGRYLDIKKVAGTTFITLDFNHAYNPYCAYSNSFSCPFPPKENNLQLRITAGEKTYTKR